ncbi:MAG: HEAT repeat domain-containing protein, partial [Planctomycetota bacterium]
MRWQLPVLMCSTVCLLATSTPVDLDVGIPPGSPVSWARRFPTITPGGPLFPKTGVAKEATADKAGRGAPKDPGKGKYKDPDGRRIGPTVTQSPTVDMDVRMSSSFGVVRIITWDLAGHLPWVARRRTAAKSGPKTGVGSGKAPPLPWVNDGLYWANTASLLRFLLHPQLVSEKELIAHLAEVGEPILAVLDNAVAEEALEPICKKLRKMITAPRAAAKPLPGATPRETMLKRFLADELVGVYPYDPEGGFGQRFLLWADEFEPLLADYLEHEDSFLRRNAAAGLSRYRTDAAMRALADVAAKTTDQVLLMRALAAVGGYRSLRKPGKLIERLENTKDPIEQIALVVALGRMGAGEAVPLLLKLGSTRDSDLLQAVLAALVRIYHAGGDMEVKKFARKHARSAHAKPERFRIKSRAKVKPDFPDGPKARGEIIEQLALLLQVRLDPRHKEARRRVLGLLAKGDRGKAGPRGGNVRVAASYPNNSLRKVRPPVRMLFLEMLRVLGDEGVAGLKSVVEDRGSEPALRGHALAQMPFFNRAAAAEEILTDEDESAEMKIYGLEVMDKDGHTRLKEIGLKLIEDCGEAEAGEGKPEERYLWLQAVRALDRRHLLKAADLLPLLKHSEVRAVTHDEIHQRIRELVVSLVDAGAAGKSRRSLRKRIDAILDIIISEGINPRITEDKRAAARKRVEDRMSGLKGHKGDFLYKNNVSSAILHYLLGFKMAFTLRDRAQFKPLVLLEEEILFALGRTKSKEAGEALAKFLDDHPKSALRPHAGLALGVCGQVAHAKKLLPLLADEYGFTRFCA